MTDYEKSIREENYQLIRELRKTKDNLLQWKKGESVSVKALHQKIVDALYEERITSKEMNQFIQIICDAKEIEDYEYDKMVSDGEETEE